MITILVDHNIEGQALTLWGILAKSGWLELIPIQLATFTDVGLSLDGTDREIWRFAQVHQMIILTDNRNMKGNDSLEQTIREENMPTALPVLTIGNMNRFEAQDYRERCANRLLEIVLHLEDYLGTGRIFIP
jgi:predicted nuclease of predicted toxin-antitoxin system